MKIYNHFKKVMQTVSVKINLLKKNQLKEKKE